MFSQNVFSTRDVLANSSLSDSVVWDSQPYSQVTSSQNSQMSSMDLFHQQIGTKLGQSEQSQSQITEEELPNYFSKYLNNPPLYPPTSNNNIKINKSMQALIDEQKQNISMKEERDMLQTFISLLKDYTKDAMSSFTSFKNELETTLEVISEKIKDGNKSIGDKIVTMKEELVSVLEARDEDLKEKEQLSNSINKHCATIKVLETKLEILEKQLQETKEKESAYVDQTTKNQQLERQYLQSISRCNACESSYLGNTPPFSQKTDPLCSFLVQPINSNEYQDHLDARTQQPFPNAIPFLNTDYEPSLWNKCQYPTNGYLNPSVINPLRTESSLNPNVFHTAPPFVNTSHLSSNSSNDYHDQITEQSQAYGARSTAHNPSSLVISRGKKPKKSPMAMVLPQVRRHTSPYHDDDIFLSDAQNYQEDLRKHGACTTVAIKHACPAKSRGETNDYITDSGSFKRQMHPDGRTERRLDQKESLRSKESVRRKRSLVSMLGMSSDDNEVQEIASAIRAQQRQLVKRIKSLP